MARRETPRREDKRPSKPPRRPRSDSGPGARRRAESSGPPKRREEGRKGPGGAGTGSARKPMPGRPVPQTSGPAEGKTERLQKVLAHAGLGSRRECEEYIVQGRVTVDGKVVRELGARVDPEAASIEVDGERIRLEKMVYYAVNKPKGYVSTNHDPSGRPRVI